VRFLGDKAQRLVQTGSSDQGDIRVGSFILQARDRAQIDLSGSLDDAHAQLLTFKRLHPAELVDYCAAVIKRRRRGIGEGYVVLTLADFARLLGDLG
jgi:hypothetical protein